MKEKGAVVAEAKNTAEGKVAFVRSFEEAGTHTYTLVEKVGTEEGIEYDKTEHTVTVTVVADDQGLLTAKVSYADGKEVVFTNKYTVPTPIPEPNPNPGTEPTDPGTNPTPGTEPTDPGQKEDPKPAPPATETKGKAETSKHRGSNLCPFCAWICSLGIEWIGILRKTQSLSFCRRNMKLGK